MKYVCGIDIGSSKIAGCIGCFRGKQLVDIWWESIPVEGVKQGFFQDVHGLTNCLAKLLKKLKEDSGVKIKSAYLGIASQNIISKRSQAVIALTEKGNRSVIQSDINRVNHQAEVLESCLEEEILRAIPLSYAVDNELEVDNAIGLYGHKLKADLYLISIKVSYINTVREVISRAGLKLNDLVLSGLAVTQAALDIRKSDGLTILCDIGKDITQVFIFKKGKLVYYQTITLGGDDLTAGLSRELKLPYSLAEEVKVSYGRVQCNWEALEVNCVVQGGMNHIKDDRANKVKETEIDKDIIIKRDDGYSILSQNSIIRILSKVSRDIAESIRDVVRPHILAGSLPFAPDKATLYVSGRTACLEGFLENLELVLNTSVKIAKVNNPVLLNIMRSKHLLSGESNLTYLAAFGLIIDSINESNKKYSSQGHFWKRLPYVSEKLTQLYQDYF